ncbi:MAG: type II toxin-antitoxin system RelB/DinJ family antitoxin [Candidatus Peregrinibacteria bacterium]|nr:type II toxin-antitoxin system RelB/DinJ family antitoxin [Candidatus Peregrinibacteria bacterium]
MAQRNLQVRLDENLRRRAEKVFKKIGIDTPTAIRVFFTKVADVGGIPFLLQSDEDHFTPKQIATLDRMAEKARKGKNLSPAFSSVDEALQYLNQ